VQLGPLGDVHRPAGPRHRHLRQRHHPLGRYFSPLAPNRPRDVDALYADNDVVLYDRETDLTEVRNLARDGAQRDLVAACSAKLEALITAEIGTDTDTWVLDRPNLVEPPAWHGDRAG
jgi:arylsulfatase